MMVRAWYPASFRPRPVFLLEELRDG